MTTLDAVQLVPSLQALVDARLDTIERMLMGRIPRQDRLAIVREVESQIQEQLGIHHHGEPSREDVLTILATLDPPEAYLPDEDEPASHVPRSIPAGLGSRNPARSSKELAGGVLGLLSLIGAGILPVLCWILAMMIESVEMLVGGLAVSTVLVLTLMTISLVLSIRAGLRKPWAVTGLVAGLCGGVVIVLITGASLFLM
jgi:hypothetical protein